jgi:hypothetical protein
MHSVYCYSANINQGKALDEELNDHRLSPPIILVGTHRGSIKQVSVRFFRIFYFSKFFID